MTKHVYAVYSTEPGVVTPPDASRVQRQLDAEPVPTLRDTYTGPAEVLAYSVVHGREGGAEWGLVVSEIDGGDRCYGRVTDADLLASMEADEWVGRRVELRESDGGVNLVCP
jgi:acetyl-CoA C-acetyltransferase